MPGRPRPTILVVEDEEPVRRLISTTLAEANYNVLEAKGGLDGLSAMLRYDGEIALAVVEIKMPGINGLDLANQIAIERPSTDILYTSGLIHSIAVESITRTTPEAVLAKPFTPEQLVERVANMFRARDPNRGETLAKDNQNVPAKHALPEETPRRSRRARSRDQ